MTDDAVPRPEHPWVGADRRHNPSAPTAAGNLDGLPTHLVLSRLSVPVLGIGKDGTIAYVNDACLAMLGYVDAQQLHGRHVSEITAPDSRCADPRDQVEQLRSRPGTVTTWLHADGHIITTEVTQPLLRRALDPLLVVCLTEVADTVSASSPPTTALPTTEAELTAPTRASGDRIPQGHRHEFSLSAWPWVVLAVAVICLIVATVLVATHLSSGPGL